MKPMLAATTDGEDIRYPVFVSPKLDGIRALVINGVVLSRSLKPIPNRHVQFLFGRSDFDNLDGELICGPIDKKTFARTTSAVMTIDGVPDIQFYVFDILGKEGYRDRIKTVLKLTDLYKLSGESTVDVVSVEQQLVESKEGLIQLEEEFLNQGYEGIMIRSIDGPYKYGRSTNKEGYLLKLKRFKDSEAIVTGSEPLYVNHNEPTLDNLGLHKRSSHKAGKTAIETLGSIVVQDLGTGVSFKIGTGFTEKDRQNLWKSKEDLQGKVIKYRFQSQGVKDKPRFPVFVGFRDIRDMGE